MTATSPDRLDVAAFADLQVCEVMDGWETIENYAMIRASIPVGKRVSRPLTDSGKASAAIRDLRANAVAEFSPYRLKKLVASGYPGIAELVYPYGPSDLLGFSVQMVALADSLCGRGGWRAGVCLPAHPKVILAKFRCGEPFALIAPARLR